MDERTPEFKTALAQLELKIGDLLTDFCEAQNVDATDVLLVKYFEYGKKGAHYMVNVWIGRGEFEELLDNPPEPRPDSGVWFRHLREAE